ncbi:MAG: DNA methylase [Promethearchaeota archaeon]|nr:MAG: DNA methylase [Candidatus Lokiarchaeota archaeon]
MLLWDKRCDSVKTFIILENTHRRPLPEQFHGADDRYPETVAEYFINQYTHKGDKVLDVFAGLGTTIFVAEEMGRIPYGVELKRDRYEYIKSEVYHKENIVHGDARQLERFDFPLMDFAISSPPYMHALDIDDYALTAYTTSGTYAQYLREMQEIFTKVKNILKPNAYVVLEVANIKRKGEEITTLAWDVAQSLKKIFHFEGEVILGWTVENTDVKETGEKGEKGENGTYGYGYDHSYGLVFRKKGAYNTSFKN